MFAKGNQPGLMADIERLFKRAEEGSSALSDRASLAKQRVQAKGERALGLVIQTESTRELGHGRMELRQIEVLGVPRWARWVTWPGAKQVFRLRRETRHKKSGKVRAETVLGITSLSPEQASPTRLLQLCRGHWSIENRSHWVRDVTFDEDRSTVRSGSMPQVMAALRNTVIGVMRLDGKDNIAAASRSYAARPSRIEPLLFNPPTFE